jgi:hypothetical protein
MEFDALAVLGSVGAQFSSTLNSVYGWPRRIDRAQLMRIA